MKKAHVTYTAIFLIVLIVLFLFLRVWSAARAVSVVGPTAIRQGGDGVIYILSNKFLYLHDKDGGFLDKIPLSKFGIDQFIGDFWIYKNGDILLRREVSRKLTISGEAEMFARTGAGEKDRLGTGESILQRCSVETFQCKNFGKGGDVFDKITNFKLFMDEEKGVTYLADTVGHQLLILDDNGFVIRKSNTPFQFPNQIALEDDGLLYVSDTNNHRVVAVKTEKENFGSVDKEFKIVHPRDPLKPTWPMALAHMQNKKWWIINADDNMSDGTVMILNEKGAFEKVLRLPDNADPLCLAVVGDIALISDPRLMRVYTVSQNGGLSDDFGSPLFKLDLSELLRERRTYELIATMSMWSLFILLSGALLLARAARVQEATETTRQAEPRAVAGAAPRHNPGTDDRYDYHSVIGIYRVKFAVITVILLVIISFFLLISRDLTVFHWGFFPVALLGHFVNAFFRYLHLKRSYIEINERGITYQGMSRHIHSPWNGVKKINVYGNSSRVVTDYGNFSIGALEPADSPPRGWLDLFRRKRVKFHKELIEKIQKRAPHAKVEISWFVRYQWQRL